MIFLPFVLLIIIAFTIPLFVILVNLICHILYNLPGLCRFMFTYSINIVLTYITKTAISLTFNI